MDHAVQWCTRTSTDDGLSASSQRWRRRRHLFRRQMYSCTQKPYAFWLGSAVARKGEVSLGLYSTAQSQPYSFNVHTHTHARAPVQMPKYLQEIALFCRWDLFHIKYEEWCSQNHVTYFVWVCCVGTGRCVSACVHPNIRFWVGKVGATECTQMRRNSNNPQTEKSQRLRTTHTLTTCNEYDEIENESHQLISVNDGNVLLHILLRKLYLSSIILSELPSTFGQKNDIWREEIREKLQQQKL